MSTFIQIPNKINQLTKKSKLNEIYTYAAIRSQIKDRTLQAAYPQEQLAKLLGVGDRTIRSYINELETAGLITEIKKQYGKGEYAHNVYQMEYLAKEYFILDPAFITDDTISACLKGLLLLMKTYCIKGTNYIRFNSREHLSEMLHIGKNQLPNYLKELEEKGFIRFIGNTLHLPLLYFKLFIKDNSCNELYQTIYEYCLSQNVTPPYRDVDTRDMEMIGERFYTPEDLLSALRGRCPQLPEQVSLAYFTKALVNKKRKMEKPVEYHPIIID